MVDPQVGQKLDLVKTFDAERLIDYVVCPGKAYINMHLDSKPARQIVKDRLRMALNDISVPLLGGTRPKHPLPFIEQVVDKVYEGIEYNKQGKDRVAVTEMFMNFINMLPDKELEVESLSRPFELAYKGVIVKSQIDLIVKDLKKGSKHPTIVDFSHTRYEPYYNPIIYRCQMAIDYMDALNTNTNVLVLTISSNKSWLYNKAAYGRLIHDSIGDMLIEMNDGRFPVRFGWWCSGCYWRGLCHRIIDVDLGI